MITRVSVRNFKAFRDAEINLNGLNLFTGLNGMGKSTFIQSLLLLKQSSTLSRGLFLKGGIINLGRGKDVYSIHANSDYIHFEVDNDFTNIINVSFKFEADSDVLPVNDNFPNKHFMFGPLYEQRFVYLKADRLAPEHIYPANLSAVKDFNFIGYKGENTPLYIALNKFEPLQNHLVSHKDAQSPNLISNIDAWLNYITPGSHVISTYFNELDIVKLGYQFDNGIDFTPEFSPVNVGFGITYTLPVITAILSAERGDLLIIENPESHLHPQGQAKMGELLARAASGGVQIIIESHSDHLLNGLRVAVKNRLIDKNNVSLFYFERNDPDEHVTNISQPVIEQDGRLSHKPNGFFDEYSKQLDLLLS